MVKKRAFSLIEILVTMVLLCSVTAVVSSSLSGHRRIFKEDAFSERVKFSLELAQRTAILYETNVSVEIFKNKTGYWCCDLKVNRIDLHARISKFFKNKNSFKVQELLWNEQVVKNSLTIDFDGSTGFSSPGILCFISKKGNNKVIVIGNIPGNINLLDVEEKKEYEKIIFSKIKHRPENF